MTAAVFPDPRWFTDVSARLAGCAYGGPPCSVEITVSGGPGGACRYGVVFVPGVGPQYQLGAQPDAEASYEQSWADAQAQIAGTFDPVVSFMQGALKVKGATRPLFELFQFWARPDAKAVLLGL